MTHNPTPAEVQAAYDKMNQHAQSVRLAPDNVLRILLAAVARDTLEWREVERDELHEHVGPVRMEAETYKETRFFIKDAAP